MRQTVQIGGWVLAAAFLAGGALSPAQRTPLDTAGAQKEPHRTRLILKDGSYQVVMSYAVVGSRVRFVSAERGGETEEIPLALVDLDATRQWEKQHPPLDANGQRPAPALDPELVKEEQDRAALSPEVATDLRLQPEDGVLALDTFRGSPELVPLAQSESDVNKQSGHGVLKGVVNPRSAAHGLVQLKGEKADVQMHVNEPVLYLRLDDEQAVSGEALTVDTHGANSAAQTRAKHSEPSGYVIVRVDVRQDVRVVSSFNLATLGTAAQPQDVFDTNTTVLPGGHWLKVAPRQPLLIGEYALVEVLNEREVNLGVWDFGIHPTAPENRDVLRPEKRRASSLEHRRPE